MARIRTIKPEFWTSEQVLECSPIARLLFIGLWNFADDAGRHPFSAKQVKAEIFPADDLTQENVRGMLDELEQHNLIRRYAIDGKEFLQITGWHHQRIDKPQKAKYPGPSEVEPGGVPRTLDEHSRLKGSDTKGSDTKGEERASALAGPPPCPQQAIVDAYHDELPTLPTVRVVSDTTAAALRRRWREDEQRQTVDWWRAYFAYVRDKCPFLLGKSDPGPTRAAPFIADFAWLVGPKNFEKVVNGRYDEGKSRVG